MQYKTLQDILIPRHTFHRPQNQVSDIVVWGYVSAVRVHLAGATDNNGGAKQLVRDPDGVCDADWILTIDNRFN
jgi:hypothetical protein